MTHGRAKRQDRLRVVRAASFANACRWRDPGRHDLPTAEAVRMRVRACASSGTDFDREIVAATRA
jgi:hypothetical protein